MHEDNHKIIRNNSSRSVTLTRIILKSVLILFNLIFYKIMLCANFRVGNLPDFSGSISQNIYFF